MEYIIEAKKFLTVAREEIDEFNKNGDITKGVDGCEKGWLAFNLLLKEFFISKGVKEEELPNTHKGTRYFLAKYGDKELRNLYTIVRDILHVDGFYSRDIDYTRVLEVFDDINKFMKKLEVKS